MEVKDYKRPKINEGLESLQGIIIELRVLASQTKNIRALTDRLADEITTIARKIKIEELNSSRLLEVIARAFEPSNRPKIYDYDILNYLTEFAGIVLHDEVEPIQVYMAIAMLRQDGIKAHYSDCDCPLYLTST